MGLFGGTKGHTKIYGKEETAALQPDLFASYERTANMGGTPDTWLYRQPLNSAINTAYESAMRELGGMGLSPEVMSQVQGRMGRLRGLDVGNIYGAIAQGAQAGKMGTTGNMAGYLSALKSSRSFPQTQQRDYTQLIARLLSAGGSSLGKLAPMIGGALTNMAFNNSRYGGIDAAADYWGGYGSAR